MPAGRKTWYVIIERGTKRIDLGGIRKVPESGISLLVIRLAFSTLSAIREEIQRDMEREKLRAEAGEVDMEEEPMEEVRQKTGAIKLVVYINGT
jgi:hypothetical protein